MKITMLTESLGSGGAERQLCTLAVEMKRRGHDVQVVTYAPGNFFLPMLEKGGVRHVFLGGYETMEWLRRIRRFLRMNRQDVVLAFLSSSASYAELSSLPFRRWGLVISERLAEPKIRKNIDRIIRKAFHLLADTVITNSHTNRLILEAMIPVLKKRTVTVYNAVDLDKYRPRKGPCDNDLLHFVVAARYNKQKNPFGILDALDILRLDHPGKKVIIDWFGNTADDPALYRNLLGCIKQKGLDPFFRCHEATLDIVHEYQKADAVILPSFYEGLPNTLCEAMACGKPIVTSAVCDAGNLVKDGKNGFLFNPYKPESIAGAIIKFASLLPSERCEMGTRSRSMAENLFDIRKIADRYEEILHASASRQPVSVEHLPNEVPDTALDFIGSKNP